MFPFDIFISLSLITYHITYHLSVCIFDIDTYIQFACMYDFNGLRSTFRLWLSGVNFCQPWPQRNEPLRKTKGKNKKRVNRVSPKRNQPRQGPQKHPCQDARKFQTQWLKSALLTPFQRRRSQASNRIWWAMCRSSPRNRLQTLHNHFDQTMNRRIRILGGLEGGSEYVHLVFSSKDFIDEAAMMIDRQIQRCLYWQLILILVIW